MAYSDKQKRSIVQEVNKKYATGKYTLRSCCKNQGISDKTFYKWDKELAEKAAKTSQKVAKAPKKSAKSSQIPQSYEEAREKSLENRRGELRELAVTALREALQVKEWEEKKQIGKWDRKTKQIEVDRMELIKKRREPNPMLIRFTLENTDPQNFKTKQVVQHEGENPFIALMKAAAQNRDNQKTG